MSGHTYAAYLASDEWAATRRRYFRSGLPTTCQGRTVNGPCEQVRVELHHWTYRNLGRELVTDLIPLCRDCHRRVHELAGSTEAKALKRATKAVCGSDILRRQQEALARRREERPEPKPSLDVVPLRDEMVAEAPVDQRALLRSLEAFGAALRRAETGKTFNRRLSGLRRLAERAGREDIVLALERYEPSRNRVSADAVIKPWDTASQRMRSSPPGKYAKRTRRKQAA